MSIHLVASEADTYKSAPGFMLLSAAYGFACAVSDATAGGGPEGQRGCPTRGLVSDNLGKDGIDLEVHPQVGLIGVQV
jgi:hypothetical protein